MPEKQRKTTMFLEFPIIPYDFLCLLDCYFSKGVLFLRTAIFISSRLNLGSLVNAKSRIMVEGALDISTSPGNRKNGDIFGKCTF